jgi:hypothetical protein
MKTFKDLTPGTIAIYNDMSNVDLEFVILSNENYGMGNYINVMNLDTRTIEPMTAHTIIDNKRWTIK